MRRVLIGALIVLAAAAPAARAQVQLVPNETGKPSQLRVDIGAEELGSSGELPTSVVLASARGFRFDRRARGATCSGVQAEEFSCPEASRIGRGSAEFVVRGPLLPPEGFPDSASIDVFIAPRAQAGDVFGVEVQVNEERFGMRGRSVGRLVPLGSGPFGSELRFDSFGSAVAPPPGYSVELRRVQFTAGAKRTVRRVRVVRRGGKRRRVRRRVSHHLIRNPRACSGAWPYELRIAFPSGEQRRPGEVPCQA